MKPTLNESAIAGGNEHQGSLAEESKNPRSTTAGRFHLLSVSDSRTLAIVVAFASIALVPIMISGIPVGGDLANHYRFALPFYDSIHSGNLYPGWLAESNAGYGDPRFRFYPPGLYYLLSAARLLLGWYGASILTFVVLSVTGSLGIYFWVRSFVSTEVAMWAGILYAIAPYHLNELYQASLLSEYAACAILPFAFGFIDRICRQRKMFDLGGLAAAFALLILTSLPLAVIGSLSIVFFAGLRIERKVFGSTVIRLSTALFLGLAASAFFWTTMLAELSWINGSSINPNSYYDYRLNFVFSPSALTNRNTWYANLLALACIAFIAPLIILLRRGINRSVGATFILTLFSLFMCTPLSRPLWAVIPKLSEVQFPWRWLAITSMSGSILVAISIPKWIDLLRTRIRPRDLVPLFAFGLALYFVGTQVVWDSTYLRQPEFETFVSDSRAGISFKDWLPIGARQITELPKMSGKVEVGSRRVEIDNWETEYRKFRLSPGLEREARVRTYYYPHWVAKTLEGNQLPISAGPDGVTLVTVPPEATTVEMEFREPKRVLVTGLLSGLSWILIAAICSLNSLSWILNKVLPQSMHLR